jgi:hypothetical protein
MIRGDLDMLLRAEYVLVDPVVHFSECIPRKGVYNYLTRHRAHSRGQLFIFQQLTSSSRKSFRIVGYETRFALLGVQRLE